MQKMMAFVAIFLAALAYVDADPFGEIQGKAAEGDARAQYQLGWMYETGSGLARQESVAAKWYKLSANQGYADSQYRLALLYYYGNGVAINHREAFKWALKAAEQGLPEAEYSVGYSYYLGDGVGREYSKAAMWFLRAAESGDASAQYYIATLYDQGKGVLKDHAEAVKWYRLAADQGDVASQFNLACSYLDGLGVAKNYAKAQEWFKNAAELGNVDAQYNLGCMYVNGKIMPEDYYEAYKWFTIALRRFPDQKSQKMAVDGQEKAAKNLTDDEIKRAQIAGEKWKTLQEKMAEILIPSEYTKANPIYTYATGLGEINAQTRDDKPQDVSAVVYLGYWYEDTETLTEITLRRLQIRDLIRQFLSQKHARELSIDKEEELKEELRERINAFLNGPGIREVLFDKFMVHN